MDLVLVSHNHYDHLQPSSLRLFADRATYVAPLGVPPHWVFRLNWMFRLKAEAHGRGEGLLLDVM